MERPNEVKLNAKDRLILESYKTVLEGLAEYLGNGYEIVLHSLEDFEHSAVKVINGEYTGRKEGAPITDLALNMLAEIQKKNLSSHICYYTKNARGEPLKSATIVIKGTEGKPIGLLCINFYLNTSLSDILLTMTPQQLLQENFRQEQFAGEPVEMIQKAVKQAYDKVSGNPAVLPSLRNREVVAILEEEGIFRMKDSVMLVAEFLNISKNTVYLHLRTIRNNK